MKYYLQLIIAFPIGQLLFIAIMAYFLQKSNEQIDYLKSVVVFFHKELGGFIVALCFWLILLFILPDLIDVRLTRAELLEKQQSKMITQLEKVQLYWRIFASALGVFAQLIPFVLFKKGKKAIDNYEKKI